MKSEADLRVVSSSALGFRSSPKCPEIQTNDIACAQALPFLASREDGNLFTFIPSFQVLIEYIFEWHELPL